mmetsp:Transcript_120323/g.221308  ORF Transcript_120323/g.221308 Transcript_120323/m.221308 type:complete len:119 (+) Transcript_120323:2-358(+)
MGLTQQQWDKWVVDIEAGRGANIFHKCAVCELCFWCFPLLCLQWLACLLLNPCSWWIIAKEYQGLERTTETINADLRRAGMSNIYCKWQVKIPDSVIIFCRQSPMIAPSPHDWIPDLE